MWSGCLYWAVILENNSSRAFFSCLVIGEDKNDVEESSYSPFPELTYVSCFSHANKKRRSHSETRISSRRFFVLSLAYLMIARNVSSESDTDRPLYRNTQLGG